MTLAEVRLWGRTIGAVLLEDGRDDAVFEYDPEFASSGIEVAPLKMPLPESPSRRYGFPTLPRGTFRGLPGLLADSLPDRFGNALIDAWLAAQGRGPETFNAIERLCYIGARGMGALEFEPATGPRAEPSRRLQVAELVQLASEILSRRADLRGSFTSEDRGGAMAEILAVGTSAGGARAKAVVAWNETTHEIRSGQVDAASGFEHWMIKFDGVSGNRDRDKDLAEPTGYGAIEYAYHLMACVAGIEMTECRLLEENGRRHFMTRRFDRLPDAGKLHMQSLGALAHFDFNAAGAHSYEEALRVIRQLDLGMDAIEQQFRRMVFNVVARNQDDHVKNIAFLMDKSGRWTLSPAFDVIYSYNPNGAWTASHQMSINGKRDNFTRADLRACAQTAMMKRGRADTILDEVRGAVTDWPRFAAAARVAEVQADAIVRTLRLDLSET